MQHAQTIERFHNELRGSDLKEAPRRDKFLVLLQALFPSSADELRRYTDGIEKAVSLPTSGAELIRRGSIDAYYGDLVIEFERSLPAKRAEAEGQLRAYCAGLWNDEKPRRFYICIATDGLQWITYHPVADTDGPLQPEDVHLEVKENLSLGPDASSHESFFLFLNRLFFREGRLKPTVEIFTRDFGVQSHLYAAVQPELAAAFASVKDDPEVALSYSEWSRYLTYTYGNIATNEQLFCKHTYLAVLARFIVWAALLEGEEAAALPSTELVTALVKGDYFERKRLLNLVEQDFFQWIGRPAAARRLERTWLKLLNQLRSYDFTQIDEDLLKGVYQELVDPVDRHDLGEYYTPDWLCERIVAELIGKPTGHIPAVIDLTCGSGGFLRAALHRIRTMLEGVDRGGAVNWDSVLAALLANVHGIDIHPLAVMIAKATYVLAIRDIIRRAKRPVGVPVHLADALLMPHTDDIVLFGSKQVTIKFAGKRYGFPHSLFGDPQAWDEAVGLCAEVAQRLAGDAEAESEEGFRAAAARHLKHISDEVERAAASRELFRLCGELAVRIRNRQDTIWSFVLRNNLRPLFLHNRYDVVVGNPPWLAYRYVSDPEYQQEVKNLSRDTYNLAPRAQKLITQMELATLFLVHATHLYLKKGGRLGYVMPRSVFSGDQHDRFRAEQFSADCDIQAYWDLKGVSPLFNVPACVVFARKAKTEPDASWPARFFDGKLKSRDLPWSAAKEQLQERKGSLHLVKLGDRNALSEKALDYGHAPAPYRSRFSQGATIVPRNFYFISRPSAEDLAAEEFFARTDPEQAKEGKPPYKDIMIEGLVETRFVFQTALAKHVLPFAVVDLPYVLLPVLKEEGEYHLTKAVELRKLGYRKAADWFDRAETEWNQSRGAKADRQDLYGWLNYQNKMMKQNPEATFEVLYNAAGKNISAGMFIRGLKGVPFYAEHTVYRSEFQTMAESLFLVSILNCEVVNQIIKPFQSFGLLGERHIEKKVLELPIPQFDRKDPVHLRLADLAESASKAVARGIAEGVIAGTLATRRRLAREAAASQLKEIDVLVKGLFEAAT